MAQWYYVDKNQQRVGPVDASVLVDALRQGQLQLNSLVWQEGMSAWQPLSMHVDAVGVPEAMRLRRPPPQKSGNAPMWIIVAVVVGFFGIAILGIMIAIALPAYQDYTVRAKVTEGLNLAAEAKMASAEAQLKNGAWPNNSAEAGYTEASGKYVSNITIPSAQNIQITYSSVVPEISGDTLMLRGNVRPDGSIEWVCNAAGSTKLDGPSGTLPAKYAPKTCR